MQMNRRGFILVSLFLFFLSVAVVGCERAADAVDPVINKQGPNWTVGLSEKMKKAIREFDPDFLPWELKDYSPRIRDSYKESGPHESPFALIVDANRDGKPDVIIDGHDKKKDLLIGIVSDHNKYKVHTIRENELSNPAAIENWNDKKKEQGLNYFLWLNKDGTDAQNEFMIFKVGYPQVEFPDGTATDGAIVDYIYENGEFREKVNEL
jgi:hypothetical protein